MPESDEVSAKFGLHRGRRVLAFGLVTGLLIWGGREGLRALDEAPPVPPPPPALVTAPLATKHATAVRPVAAKHKAKAARTVSRGSLPSPAPAVAPAVAPSEPEPNLSAPPLVAGEGVEHAAPIAPAPIAEDPVAPEAIEPDRAAPEAIEPVHPAPEAESVGDGNGEAIARAIAIEKRRAVQDCFERELKQTPTLKGNVTVELDLAPPQQVNGVRVTDDLDRPAFTQCVSSTMQHLSFVALNEEVSVHVPYVLTARAK